MSVALLSIGTELTRGEIVNTNSSWLCEHCTQLGFEVSECVTIPDDLVQIGTALTRLSQSSQIIIGTGGLGPTTDDITAQAVARLLDVPLERDEAGLLQLRERFAQAGRTFHEANTKQLDFPRGAKVLANLEGTAPGFQVQIGKARAYFLPGVPSEMKPMFERSVVPELDNTARRGVHQIRFKTFGMPEAAVNELLRGVEERYGVTLGYRAHFPEIEVKVLARAPTSAEARTVATNASQEVRAKLEAITFAEGDLTLAESVGQLLRERGLKLALAESCTGGLVGHLLCQSPSSDYFLGGIVCYANSVKQELLEVDPRALAEKGAVSAEVAEQMALGAQRVLGADLALSITGIAGPSGGSEDKPVGLVHYAVASAQGVTLHQTQARLARSRDQIRLHAAYSGLWLLRSVLRKS